MSNAGSAPPDPPSRLALPIGFAPLLFVVGIVGLFSGARLAHDAGAGLRATLMTAEAGLVLPSLLAVLLLKVPLGRGVGLRSVSGRTALLSLFAGASLWLVSLGLMSLQSLLWPPSEAFLETFKSLHDALRPSTPLEAILSVVAIAVTPALCEETVFRGTLLPACLRWFGAGGAIFASAVLFSLIHLDTSSGEAVFYRLPFTFVVGLALGALRVSTGSLVPPILAHATLNTITFLTVLLTGAASEALDAPSTLLGLPLLVVGGLLTVVLMRALRAARHVD